MNKTITKAEWLYICNKYQKWCLFDEVRGMSLKNAITYIIAIPISQNELQKATYPQIIEVIKILGLDIAHMPDSYNIQYIKIVQVRKHKKKRINKKWLKRYGYKKVIVNSKGWDMKTYTDGTVEFVKIGE